ncbi:MAG: PUA domain-containing protein [Candidatus Helarchaeota archaeon]
MERIDSRDSMFKFFLRQIRLILQYQFDLAGKEARIFFPDHCVLSRSKKTNKIRFVHVDGRLICTLKPTDGMFTLSLDGALLMQKIVKSPRLRVVVQSDVAPFIREGRNVFAKHVKRVDGDLRPHGEVMIVDEQDSLLGVGRMLLNQKEIEDFNRGLAVHTRHGMKRS